MAKQHNSLLFNKGTIYPKLFDQIYLLQILIGTNKPIQLASGYCSVETNNPLRRKSSVVAKNSHYIHGRAMDFHIKGVELSHIRKVALKMRVGGVGY